MDIEYNKPYTYKEMCELMGSKRIDGGRHRKLQLKRWRKKYIIDKSDKRGSKYTILGKISIDNIYKWKHKDSFIVSTRNKNKSGVYLIKYDDYIYIGQTNNFQKRFCQHIETKSFTSKLINNGGKFYILCIEEDYNKRLELEKYYIELYKNMGYCLYNRELNSKNSNSIKYTNIKIKSSDLEFVKTLLKENNIEWK